MNKNIVKAIGMIISFFIIFDSLQVYGVAKQKGLPSIVCEDVIISAGSTVKLTVSIKDNPGVIAMKLQVSYDKNILRLKNVQNGSVFPESAFTSGKNVNSMPYILLWEDGLSKSDYTKSGVLVELYFTVIDVPVQSDTSIKLSCDNGSCFNVKLENINFNVRGANVKIRGALGDLNCDGTINSTDALMVLQYSVGLIKLDDRLKKVGNVNHDNAVNSMDALKILEFSIGKIKRF